jgi:hypothetical protein
MRGWSHQHLRLADSRIFIAGLARGGVNVRLMTIASTCDDSCRRRHRVRCRDSTRRPHAAERLIDPAVETKDRLHDEGTMAHLVAPRCDEVAAGARNVIERPPVQRNEEDKDAGSPGWTATSLHCSPKFAPDSCALGAVPSPVLEERQDVHSAGRLRRVNGEPWDRTLRLDQPLRAVHPARDPVAEGVQRAQQRDLTA